MNKPITLCDRCKIAVSCLLNYETLCRKNRTVKPTNADRIRAMTDEELAEFIASNEWGHIPRSEKWWLEWLQEVQE